MNSYSFRTPARRLTAAAAVGALAAGPAVLASAVPAQATGGHGGKSSAVVLRTGLDVSLLDKSVNVPLTVSLNEVQAPQSAEKTALTAQLDGVDGGKPFSVLRADVATAKATVDEHKAEGYTNLAHAKVQVPGLPLLSLIEVEKVTSKAVCEAGKQPVAESNVLGAVTVFGKKVTLTAGGTSEVKVPGVGEVRLDLSKTHTTTRTAAATALELKVSVNPLKLNVAEVEGTVTLAGATCEAPDAPSAQESDDAPSGEDASGTSGAEKDVRAQGAAGEPVEGDLAETGGSSATPYIAGVAAVLVAAGGGALVLTRRRRQG
ncbi:SCO1860 family LAETG-anchored protein [Streptomyces sp. NPDC002896]|uniref:SCO1860 family LAETG-anchored protein n=1 Tax=Streptomyces sp. NPDC002896 TaxID=3154438 RepID=UPI003316EBF6